jgi:ADP-ribose pyrophosphatase YjhB (NUDIX family)
LIERAKPFYLWAVPGGFVDIGKIVEQAAFRETQEEIRQLQTNQTGALNTDEKNGS